MTDNYFIELSNINVNDKIEKKGKLNYLSWAYAWSELKKIHPNSTYKVYEHPDTYCNYFSDGKTCWVKVGVTVNNIEHIEDLPVMNNSNKSIIVDDVTSMDVNKTIQRALTKAIARHGLGLYIYAGEDLINEEQEPLNNKVDINPTLATEEQQKEIVMHCKKGLGGLAGQLKIKLGSATDTQYLAFMRGVENSKKVNKDPLSV